MKRGRPSASFWDDEGDISLWTAIFFTEGFFQERGRSKSWSKYQLDVQHNKQGPGSYSQELPLLI